MTAQPLLTVDGLTIAFGAGASAVTVVDDVTGEEHLVRYKQAIVNNVNYCLVMH